LPDQKNPAKKITKPQKNSKKLKNPKNLNIFYSQFFITIQKTTTKKPEISK